MDRQPEQGRRTVCITAPTTHPFYFEFCETLLDTLSQLGFQPTVVQDGDRDALAADILLFVGMGLPCYTNLLSHWQGRRPTTILWQFEPFPPPTLNLSAARRGLWTVAATQRVGPSGWVLRLLKAIMPLPVRARIRAAIFSLFFFNQPAVKKLNVLLWYWMSQYIWLKEHFAKGWLDFIFTSTMPKHQFLTHMGFPTRFVPVGYHPRMGINLARERDIEVLFLGSMANRRRKVILESVRRGLALRGIKLVTLEGYYGEQRTELLNRARILLNVTHHPCDFAGERFVISMGCGTLVVSEPLGDTTPYRAGEHFVQASLAELPDTIGYYLAHEDERQAITAAAYRLVTQEVTLPKAVAEMMNVCGMYGETRA